MFCLCVFLGNNKSIVIKNIKCKTNETLWWRKKQLVYCSVINSQVKTKICLKAMLKIGKSLERLFQTFNDARITFSGLKHLIKFNKSFNKFDNSKYDRSIENNLFFSTSGIRWKKMTLPCWWWHLLVYIFEYIYIFPASNLV